MLAVGTFQILQYWVDMFYGASSFYQDLSGWCVSNISAYPYKIFLLIQKIYWDSEFMINQ